MLYAIAHWIRNNCPWIWDAVEWINSWLFYMRYRSRLKKVDGVLAGHCGVYSVESLNADSITQLRDFFNRQPEEAFIFFKPHGFDEKTIRKIQKSKSFLTYIVKENKEVVGYFFLRCYFIGKAFRGYMVDHQHRNKGISKLTAKVMTDITKLLDIPSYGTISPDNMASMKSQNAKIIKQLKNGDYYVSYDS